MDVDWEKVLSAQADWVKKVFKVDLWVDGEVTSELKVFVDKSLSEINLDDPSIYKKAGIVTFWIRKLRPLVPFRGQPKKWLVANEMVALIIGLAICRQSKEFATINLSQPPYNRIIKDWIHSLRYHSHSPNSSVISFELLGAIHDELKKGLPR
jgi:hypothetical protein